MQIEFLQHSQVKTMDGNMEIMDQVKLMRAVIGRKVMEIDDYEAKAAETTGDESEKCLNMIDFLTNDIAGYKTIVEDLKDGSNDMTGNLYDIASLPSELAQLYMDFYLPSLPEADREEEDMAMELKAKYAVDLARSYVMHVGRMALVDPKILDMIMANEELIVKIGNEILDCPEIVNALNAQQ